MKTELFINDQLVYGNSSFLFEVKEQWWDFHNEFIWDFAFGPGAMAFWNSAERSDFIKMWCAA